MFCATVVNLWALVEGKNKQEPFFFVKRPKNGIPWERNGEGGRLRHLETGSYYTNSLVLVPSKLKTLILI